MVSSTVLALSTKYSDLLETCTSIVSECLMYSFPVPVTMRDEVFTTWNSFPQEQRNRNLFEKFEVTSKLEELCLTKS